MKRLFNLLRGGDPQIENHCSQDTWGECKDELEEGVKTSQSEGQYRTQRGRRQWNARGKSGVIVEQDVLCACGASCAADWRAAGGCSFRASIDCQR